MLAFVREKKKYPNDYDYVQDLVFFTELLQHLQCLNGEKFKLNGPDFKERTRYYWISLFSHEFSKQNEVIWKKNATKRLLKTFFVNHIHKSN